MYEDTHRTFLQMLIQAGIMSEYEVERTVEKIFHCNNSSTFHISLINLKLEPLNMMIKSGCSEFTGEKYYMLAGTTKNNIAKFQTEFTQGQLALLRKVFTEIISSPEGNVSSIFCLNHCSQLENPIGLLEAEKFLLKAIQCKWLDAKDGKYYMGVRSIIELMPYFMSTYQDGFNMCPLCKQTVFHGRRCEECQVVAHLYCLATFAKIQSPLQCSNCNNALPANDLPDVPNRTMHFNEATELEHEPSQTKRRRSNKNN